MSIGPSNIAKVETIHFQRFRSSMKSTKKLVTVYFKDPAYYLFYTSLTATIIALLFGATVPYPLYIILFFLTGPQVYDWHRKHNLRRKK